MSISQSQLSDTEREDLNALYSPEYPDFTLQCGNLKFKVQRSILARQSDYFKTLFSGPWNENSDRIIKLEEHDPIFLEQALRFIYARTYAAVQQPSEGKLMFNVRLFDLADSILAPKLQTVCLSECLILLQKPVPLKEMTDVVKLVFGANRANDAELCKSLLVFCASHLEDYRRQIATDERQSKALPQSHTTPQQNFGFSSGFLVDRKGIAHSTVGLFSNSPYGRNQALDKKTETKEQQLRNLIETLEKEEPLAWTLQLEHVAQVKKLNQQLDFSIDERAGLELKLKETQRTAGLQSSQLQDANDLVHAYAEERGALRDWFNVALSHTMCRVQSCRQMGLDVEKDPAGAIKGLKCSKFRAKHNLRRQ